MSNPLLVIVGPTASGKSAWALDIAEHLNGEIICADSSTIRRELNIGSAKPSIKDRTQVRHHLLDIIGPDDKFSAADFKQLAGDRIIDIQNRGKLPILVGGAGLYIDGVIFDYEFLPPADPTYRESLNQLSNQELIYRVNQLGLDSDSVDRKNNRRLIRLIETKGAIPKKQELKLNTLIIGLQLGSEALSKRIELRVDEMFESGLEKEVKDLVEKYDWGCEGLKAVGYAQWNEYFNGARTIEQTRQSIIRATKDLAKRQNTWFKRNKSIHWYATPVKWQDVAELFTTYLSNKHF